MWRMASFCNAARLSCLGFALLGGTPAAAQYIGEAPPPLPLQPVGPESAANALARNVRILAQSPRDYLALIGAGRAALTTGDPEAAVGFFSRAADVSPSAAVPHAGLGAALVAMGEATRALSEFDQAQRLGALATSLAADRGLARDLLGQQALAQAQYRLALTGPDPTEARRRLALSLAIAGDRSGALAAIGLLPQRGDVATGRVRAFVLALAGDADAADRALESSVPGMSAGLDPFFRRLPGLSSTQKAAAVHLGIFPGAGEPGAALASSTPRIPSPRSAGPSAQGGTIAFGLPTETISANRLAGVDALLSQPEPSAQEKQQAAATVPATSPPPAPQPHYEIATATSPSRVAAKPSVAPSPAAGASSSVVAPRRIWVQLASGADERALGSQFARIAASQPELFGKISPFISDAGGRSRLLVGPFRSKDDSDTFVENLAEAHVSGFAWTSPAGQVVRKLSTQ